MSSVLLENLRKVISSLNLIKNKGSVGNQNISLLGDEQNLFDNFLHLNVILNQFSL
jgi:hypothetical protein